MTVVEESIAAQIASLPRVMLAPSGNLGWGSDLSCADDVDPGFREIAQDDKEGISQALYRRLITPRGSLIEDQEYGYQVATLVHSGMADADLRAAAGAIRNELTKDDRVSDVSVTLTRTTTDQVDVAVTVVPEDPALATFQLIMALTDATLLMEAL